MSLISDIGERPKITQVHPGAAIQGGELEIRGIGFSHGNRPKVLIGDVSAHLLVGSDSFVIARVPEGADSGSVHIDNGERISAAWLCDIGMPIASEMHPVASPAVDAMGNVYTAFSGPRGQRTPVSVYRIDKHRHAAPMLSDIMNATAVAFDRNGLLYVSSRQDGIVYQSTPTGELSIFVEGMGVATGMAFDDDGNLYVGDRSGTIFKVSPQRQIYVFATIEASIAAYHLAFGTDKCLYITGPTTSSFDVVNRITPSGDVEVFYRGLGRPQGLAFDAAGNLYVAASIKGRRGIVRITPQAEAELFLSGQGIVGLAFTPTGEMIIATSSAIHLIDVSIPGRAIWPC